MRLVVEVKIAESLAHGPWGSRTMEYSGCSSIIQSAGKGRAAGMQRWAGAAKMPPIRENRAAPVAVRLFPWIFSGDGGTGYERR